jgi:hypothetical protein
MVMIESELRQKLSSLLSGDVVLDDFEDWFALESWNFHQASLPAARRLVGEIELRLSEHSSGHLLDDELFREFEALVLNIPINVATSSNSTVGVFVGIGAFPSRVLTSASVTLPRRIVPVPA